MLNPGSGNCVIQLASHVEIFVLAGWRFEKIKREIRWQHASDAASYCCGEQSTLTIDDRIAAALYRRDDDIDVGGGALEAGRIIEIALENVRTLFTDPRKVRFLAAAALASRTIMRTRVAGSWSTCAAIRLPSMPAAPTISTVWLVIVCPYLRLAARVPLVRGRSSEPSQRDLAFVAAIPVMDAVGLDVDHDHAIGVDTLGKPALKIR